MSDGGASDAMGAQSEIDRAVKARAMRVRCSSCGAEAGATCVDLATGAFHYPLHQSRRLAGGFAPGETPTTPRNRT